MLQVLAVGVATACTLSRRCAARRFGLMLLTAWVGLWLGNSLWMESLTMHNHPSSPMMLGAVAIFSVVAFLLEFVPNEPSARKPKKSRRRLRRSPAPEPSPVIEGMDA